ncbi:DNA mismatch repair protein MSH2 [Vigna unguiculata]|uniref:DNA mismatch repair protein MSH2 n=1 Tax=Vigna unguiculata TaxID=3917 RepID=A0A4D6N747_VIGUN|nr:DNA mismatch repair protein MSH2 [Vigna unguiculata]
MFGILFGWSKASKCKRTIKRARCRLGLLKNKRLAIARQLRKDLAELIQSGHEETALNRVGQLIADESLASAYELLDEFCEFVLKQLSYIRRHRDRPNDINEAVSSLIFASARCGELPELGIIRNLFGQRYGERFATIAVELFPGNLVNKQLKEKLSVKSVPDEIKYRMLDEIARDNCLQQKVLAIEYYPLWKHLQMNEDKGYQLVESDAHKIDSVAGSKVYPSEIEEKKRDVTCANSFSSKTSDSSLPESASAMVPVVQQYPPYIVSFPSEKEVVEIDFPELVSSVSFDTQNKGERMALTCSSQSAPYPEEMVQYVDDMEEFSEAKDCVRQDQMLLKFRCSGFDESDVGEDGSKSENSSTRSCRKSQRKQEKRSRRRSLVENLGRMDIGYMIYYHKPCKSLSAQKHRTHYHRKQHKPFVEGILPPSYDGQKRLMLQGFSEEGPRREVFNFQTSGCSLNQPCYFCLYNDEELVTIPQRPNRRSYSNGTEYGAFNYSDCVAANRNHEMCASPKVSNERNSWCSRRIETKGSYSRAMSMPQERHQNGKDNMLRTYSCFSQHPNHVHPKLPDYDEIAAKFTALKRERLENMNCSGDQNK